MNGCDMYRIEPDAPKKPTAMNIFGMILQTVFAVVLYVVAVDMMCLLTTWLGGFMFEISESNTVIPLHSWRLVAFRVYWVVLGAAFVAALAHKWIVLLTGGRESDMCELLGELRVPAHLHPSSVRLSVCWAMPPYLIGGPALPERWLRIPAPMITCFGLLS